MDKILLVDVDSKIPNLALMKLSTYYKSQGASIDIQRLNYTGYPDKRNKTIISAKGYNKVFASNIFTINKDWVEIKDCDDVNFGGTGYDVTINLPEEIDNCKEDYSIYPDNNKSFGFITRGCIRKCPFVLSQERKVS